VLWHESAAAFCVRVYWQYKHTILSDCNEKSSEPIPPSQKCILLQASTFCVVYILRCHLLKVGKMKETGKILKCNTYTFSQWLQATHCCSKTLYYGRRCASVTTWALPWFRWTVTALSPQRPGLEPRPVHGRFVPDKVALRQVFLRVLSFSLVTIIPPILHTHSFTIDVTQA
jgi:hypothetical protein